MELLAIRKTGERFPIELDSVVLPGEPTRTFVIVRDITERKRAEQVLRESEAERAAQQERARLARDLHDSVTQALFAATLKAEALAIASADAAAGRRAPQRRCAASAAAPWRRCARCCSSCAATRSRRCPCRSCSGTWSRRRRAAPA